MTFFSALFRLARPVNALITFITVFVAAAITGTLHPLPAVTLAAFSAALIGSAANTINDYADIEIDRINKPGRPLAAGRMAARTALRAAIAEYALGLLAAVLISGPMFIIALCAATLTIVYSLWLKGTVLWGNIVVSLVSAVTFIYGGTAVHRPREAIIPAIFAFFFHFGREIIKDMEDMAGDRLANARTFPIRYGEQPAIRLVQITFALLITLTLIPYFQGWYGPVYLLILLIGMYPVLLYLIVRINRTPSPAQLGFLSNLLKADMLVGLLAIYFR